MLKANWLKREEEKLRLEEKVDEYLKEERKPITKSYTELKREFDAKLEDELVMDLIEIKDEVQKGQKPVFLSDIEEAVNYFLRANFDKSTYHQTAITFKPFSTFSKRFEDKILSLKLGEDFDEELDNKWYYISIKGDDKKRELKRKGKTIPVTYKSYFTFIPVSQDPKEITKEMSDFLDAIAHSTKRLQKLSKETGNAIDMKTPSWPFFTLYDQDNFVVHYRTKKEGPKIRKIISEEMLRHNVNLQRSPYRSSNGFDLSGKTKMDEVKNPIYGSHTQLISRVVAYKLFIDSFKNPEEQTYAYDLINQIRKISRLPPQKLLDELEAIPKDGKVNDLEFRLYSPEKQERKLVEAMMERLNVNDFLKDLKI